jgi:hypothetical protein
MAVRLGAVCLERRLEDMTVSYCPIGCLVADTPGDDVIGFEGRISKKLGFPVSVDEMWAFIEGFDNTRVLHKNIPQMRKLGEELRAQYIKPVDPEPEVKLEPVSE